MKLQKYFSSREKTLVSYVKNVITCENYCKWYSLYYINNKGEVSPLHETFETFHDEVDVYEHSFEPKSLVEFAIHHKLLIGKESYKAICHMYAEYIDDDCIPDEHLPNKENLTLVLVEDNGDWSNCFSYGLKMENFKYYSNEDIDYKKFRPIRITDVDVYNVNPNMFEVYVRAENCTGMTYHTSTIDDIGSIVQSYIDECVICDDREYAFDWENQEAEDVCDIDNGSMYDAVTTPRSAIKIDLTKGDIIINENADFNNLIVNNTNKDDKK